MGKARAALKAWNALGRAIDGFADAFSSSPRSALKDVRTSVRDTYQSTKALLGAELHSGDMIAEAKAFAQKHVDRPLDEIAGAFVGHLHAFKHAVGEALDQKRPAHDDVRRGVGEAYFRADGLGHLMAERGIDAQLKERRATLESLYDPASPTVGGGAHVQQLANQLLDDIQGLEQEKAELMRESASSAAA